MFIFVSQFQTQLSCAGIVHFNMKNGPDIQIMIVKIFQVCFVYTTMASVSLSKEVCLCLGTDWLKLICQSAGGERSTVLGQVGQQFD